MPTEIEAWRQGMDWLRDAGAEIVDVGLPHTNTLAGLLYYCPPSVLQSGAFESGMAHEKWATTDGMYARTRGEGFGDEVKAIGTYALSAGYCDAYCLKGLQVRRLIAQDFENT